MTTATLGILLAARALTQDAGACGGFFCSSVPIEQQGENVVFAVDPDTGTVETHVQITYTGSAQDFAWVVPVPSNPELFVSTEELFTQLSWRTQPQFRAEVEYEGDCGGGYGYGGYAYDSDVAYSASTAAPESGDGGIVVVQELQVGPYETVVLQAASSAELVDWLQEHDYDLPDTLDPVLAPYVSSGSFFVALRLANDKDVGDIAPLGMRYVSEKAGIPIQLTSIAATPDMRLRVWVFGKGRAVPESYLHVKINEAAIDWTEGGDNYENVITLAANEAGGHAFATDYAGSTSETRGMLWWDGRYDPSQLAQYTDPIDFMNQLIGQGYPANDALLNLLQAYLPPPDGVEPTDYYNCLECFADQIDTSKFDPVAFAADIDEVIVQPLIHAESLFTAHPWLSRLTSSLSADEMTVDPVFVINKGMGAVPTEHEARIVYECGPRASAYEARRRLELSDGRVIRIPSGAYLDSLNMTVEDWLERQTEIHALIVEKTSADGDPEIIADYTDAAWAESDLGDDLDDEEDDAKGCGCATSPVGLGGALWIGGLAGLAGLRRRRAHSVAG